MSEDLSLVIQQIEFPPEHLDALKRITPLVIAGMERDGLPIESGVINIGRLDPELDLAYFFFGWISECNSVIENLNLTLKDLHSLPILYRALGGSPWSRYELLVRVYFHEFYRFRELLNAVLSASVKRGYITKNDQVLARDAFHSAIEGTIELRNSLVHGHPTWHGQEHFDLNLVSMAHVRGYRLVHKGTSEELNIEVALRGACSKSATALKTEGCKVVELMNAFVRDFVLLTSGT